MNDLIDLMQLTIPALLVFATAYYFFNMLVTRVYRELDQTGRPADETIHKIVKEFLAREEKKQLAEMKADNIRVALPLRLQAYERCVLFLERISPVSLILRIAQPGMSALQFQVALSQTVRDEFEHNLSQQIYISGDAWDKLRTAKEEMLKYINSAASGINENAGSAEYAAALMDLENKNHHSAHAEALKFIADEARTVLG